MKIGILTYHRAENYGALLQAYAMRTYLQGLGHEATFVDYWPKYHSDYYSLFSLNQITRRTFFKKILYIVKCILWLIPRYKRKKKFNDFMHFKLGLPDTPKYKNRTSTTEKYDLVLYGSDQIWRKQRLDGVLFDSWYYGSDNITSDIKIVYAGSMGAIDCSPEDDTYIRNMMANFSRISVREKDLQVYLSKMGIKASLVIDPVFLLSKDQWEKIECRMHRNGKYILFYNLLNSVESVEFAESLSKKRKIPIVEINKTMNFCHIGSRYVYSTSVEVFLALIHEAEYIVSNSFHGVAMSIIFEKQFYAVGMGKKANRVLSLLNNLGIEDSYIDGRRYFSDIKIDYKRVKKQLQMAREESVSFLHHSIDCKL